MVNSQIPPTTIKAPPAPTAMGEFRIPPEAPGEVPAAGFSASAVIKRSEFGVAAGIPYVGDELSVRITAEAMEAAGFAKAMQAMAAKEKAPKQ